MTARKLWQVFWASLRPCCTDQTGLRKTWQKYSLRKRIGAVRGMKTSEGSPEDTQTHTHRSLVSVQECICCRRLVLSPCWLKRYPYPAA